MKIFFRPINTLKNDTDKFCFSPKDDRMSPLNSVYLQVPNKKISPCDFIKNVPPSKQRKLLQDFYWELGDQILAFENKRRFETNKNLFIDPIQCKNVVKSFLKFLQIKETKIPDDCIKEKRVENIKRVIEKLEKEYFFLHTPYDKKKLKCILNFNLQLYRNINLI